MTKLSKWMFTVLAFLLITGLAFATFKKTTNTTAIEKADEIIYPDTTPQAEEKIKDDVNKIEIPPEVKKEFSPNLASLGKNEHGQRGESSTKESTSLLTPVEIGETFVKIAAGRSHGVGITNNGDVYTWGRNNLGQLGYKTDDIKYNPIPHLVMSGVSDLAVGQDHTLILKKDGTVWAFGSNYTAALGDGTNTDRITPVKLNISRVKNIFTGYKFSMAIDTNGKVYAWGATCAPSGVRAAADLAARLNSLNGGYYDPIPSVNPDGYDHNEDCINEAVIGIHSKSPIEMTTLSGITKDISIGYGHALILQNDGSLWSFGCNLYGQMGNRTYNNKVENAKPQKILDIANVEKISAGFRHSLAITTDGTIYMWGLNSKIEQGYKLLNSSSPVPVDGLDGKDIKKIIAGYDISFALMNNGKVYAWGANTNHVVKDAKDQILLPVLMALTKKITVLAPGIDSVLFLTQ